MTKDELVQQIANRRTQIAEIEVEIENLREQLAAMADWRVGDIVSTVKGVFKLTNVFIFDDGEVDRWTIYAAKQLKSGKYSNERRNTWQGYDDWKLIERQP